MDQGEPWKSLSNPGFLWGTGHRGRRISLRKFWRVHRQTLLAIGGIGGVYLVLSLLGGGCPIRFLTGIPCPGCGMTRAVWHILRLEFAAGLAAHPLVVVLPVMAGGLLLGHRLPAKGRQWFWIGIGLVFLAVYLLRLVNPGDPVVTVDLTAGFIYRLLTGGLYH